MNNKHGKALTTPRGAFGLWWNYDVEFGALIMRTNFGRRVRFFGFSIWRWGFGIIVPRKDKP